MVTKHSPTESRCRNANGFSIVELMVGLAILSALLALGIPAYTTYLQNARLSANANTFLGMLRSARAEAIKTNRPVDIILTDQGVGNYDLVAAASTVSGRNFIVRSNLTAGPKLVDSRSAQEGAAQLVGIRGSVPSITFTGLGTTTLGAVGRINFTSPDPNNCAAKNGIARCQRVCVYPSGRALVCDTAAVPMDTRACPAECQE